MKEVTSAEVASWLVELGVGLAVLGFWMVGVGTDLMLFCSVIASSCSRCNILFRCVLTVLMKTCDTLVST